MTNKALFIHTISGYNFLIKIWTTRIFIWLYPASTMKLQTAERTGFTLLGKFLNFAPLLSIIGSYYITFNDSWLIDYSTIKILIRTSNYWYERIQTNIFSFIILVYMEHVYPRSLWIEIPKSKKEAQVRKFELSAKISWCISKYRM